MDHGSRAGIYAKTTEITEILFPGLRALYLGSLTPIIRSESFPLSRHQLCGDMSVGTIDYLANCVLAERIDAVAVRFNFEPSDEVPRADQAVNHLLFPLRIILHFTTSS